MTFVDKIAALPEFRNPEETLDRSVQFAMMRLPGQPMAMHMGTSYLVNDLAGNLRSALARLALAREILDSDWLYQCLRFNLEMSAEDIRALLAALEVPK